LIVLLFCFLSQKGEFGLPWLPPVDTTTDDPIQTLPEARKLNLPDMPENT